MTTSTPMLHTRRLTLVPLRGEDAAQIQSLFGEWEVVRFLNAVVPWPYPDDGARQWIENIALPAVARGEAWHWTLRLQSAPHHVIGAIGLMTQPDDNRGFWLGAPWRRQGLMTEAVAAVTDFWFNTLKFDVLRVAKATVNVGSRRISEKTGMRRVGTSERDYVSGRLPTELWEITAGEWNSRRAVTLRHMRPEDARRSLEIHHTAVRNLAVRDYPAEVIEAWAAAINDDLVERVRAGRDGEVRLVAEIDGEPVGFGALAVSTSELVACYVMPHVARRGIGTALVGEMERVAREHYLDHLRLSSSLTAEPFYAALGYTVESRGEFRLRSGVVMAAVHMRKSLR